MIIPEGRGDGLEFRDSKPYLDYEARMKAEDHRYIFGPPKPPHPLADNQMITGCPTCGGVVIETVDEDGTPTYDLLESQIPMWTPRELIESLQKWNPDEPIEVHMQNNPLGGPTHPIIMTQGTNSINLMVKE